MTLPQVSLPDGRVVSFEIAGLPAAPVVLLSNPLLADFRLWDPFVGVLLNKGYRVLRYDQPGHGASSSPSTPSATTFETLSADVEMLLHALDISQLEAWIGISMGAATGAVFVTRNPGAVRKLVLSDTPTSSPIHAGIPDPFEPRVALARQDEGAIEKLTEQTLARWFRQEWREAHACEVQRVRQSLRTTSREGFITCCHVLQHHSFDLSLLRARIAPAVESVLLAVGELDGALPKQMAALRVGIQDAATARIGWAVFRNAGHVPVIDAPQQFSDVVISFLNGRFDSHI